MITITKKVVFTSQPNKSSNSVEITDTSDGPIRFIFDVDEKNLINLTRIQRLSVKKPDSPNSANVTVSIQDSTGQEFSLIEQGITKSLVWSPNPTSWFSDEKLVIDVETPDLGLYTANVIHGVLT